jgi:glycosyltransferase involved in cell wall biosynthesis
MVHYSVVIPQRNSAQGMQSLVARLEAALEPLVLPYEIICVDDASDAANRRQIELLRGEQSRLRLLRFDEPRGTSAALSAGIAATRGELVIAVGTQGNESIKHLPHLIAHLSRHDLVVAKNEERLGSALRAGSARLFRALAADADLRSGETLFWAASRRVVYSLALARGAFRALPEIAAKRGFRICQLTVAPDLPVHDRTWNPGMAGRITAYWLDRGFEPHRASEATANGPAPADIPFAGRAVSLRGVAAATRPTAEIKTTEVQ